MATSEINLRTKNSGVVLHVMDIFSSYHPNGTVDSLSSIIRFNLHFLKVSCSSNYGVFLDSYHHHY